MKVAEPKSKLMDLAQAIEKYVHDGDLVYLTGWTQLEGHAAMHEIIRQRRKDLVLARCSVNQIYDQAVAAGVARKLVFSYAGNPGVGLLGPARRAMESGRIEWEEHTHYQLLARLQAGASGLPFFPILSGAGSDLVTMNTCFKTVRCPYTDRVLTVVPPLKPDVAIVHAQRADIHGNLQIWGVMGDIREAVFASRAVVATVEEIVDEAVIRSDPNRTVIPGFMVNALAVCPYGAHPSFAQGYYDRDNRAYFDWAEICRDDGAVADYMKQWVFDVPDRAAYVQKLGAKALRDIEVRSFESVPVNYGRND